MKCVAEQYVKLVLALGEHDPDYVDAYYGPEVWRNEIRAAKKSLPVIKSEASLLLTELPKIDASHAELQVQLRKQYLSKQLQSLIVRVELLQGKKLSFDEEAKALYDAEPPHRSDLQFSETLGQIDSVLAGKGTLIERYDGYKRKFVIPVEKLDGIFSAAITECRARTKKHIDLPSAESFTVEYVKNKSWSGYNWYKGNSYSVIQVNTDLPIYIDRAVDLAAHEGYPGHHVYNALLEDSMVRERKWVEFSVYALFSPQSLIAEGTANFGIEVAFPGKERLDFEKSVLFPLAGIDPALADQYYKLFSLVSQLSYAGNEAARRYLNGHYTKEETASWLIDYALMPRARAEQRVRFFDQYRSYVINYNLGLDLVRRYIERHGGTADDPAKRWEEFGRLLASPRLPSGLIS
jgi:hypothetical protein